MELLYALLYLALLGVLAQPVGQALPRRWFDPERPPYRLCGWERGGAVYDAVKIKAWKDRVPDMSKLLRHMVKKEIPRRSTAADVRAVLLETCVAECVHWALIVLSLGVLGIWRSPWCILLYLVYNILGNLPFILIQRYNRPRLLALYRKMKQREERL